MFTSIRSRLWLTYAITIVTALFVVAIIFIIYLLGNPLIYRQTRLRLTVVEAELIASQANWSNLPTADLQNALTIKDKELDVRLLVLGAARQVLVDSRAGQAAPLDIRPLLRLLRLNPTVMNDNQGQAWLYVSRRLNNGNLLVVAVPRPKVAFINILTDDLMPPLLWSGALALVLTLFIAFWMARWVADPLQGLVNAAHEFSGGKVRPLEIKGPQEVQELVSAFNQMTSRVQSGQQSQREFVANVSHELKTPLTSIQGFAQAILDGMAATPEEQKQSAQVIFKESERMHRLVIDLLDLARLDAGIADLKRTSVDLTALLNAVGERFTPQANKAGVVLEIQSDNLPQIIGDGDRLAQVFTNLVDNALKFTPAGGTISIKAVVEAEFINISVTDNGAGIPEASQPHIFDRFYQADASRQGGEKHGAGLGLAIVREIVRAHGGNINFTSKIGQGSEFVVQLPLSNPEATPIIRKNRKA